MTPQEKQEFEEMKALVYQLMRSDRYTFQKHLQLLDGRNINLGATTGTMIGTSSTQKLGLFGVSPVVQQSAIGAPTAPGAVYSQSEAASAVSAINSIRVALQNLGITA